MIPTRSGKQLAETTLPSPYPLLLHTYSSLSHRHRTQVHEDIFCVCVRTESPASIFIHQEIFPAETKRLMQSGNARNDCGQKSAKWEKILTDSLFARESKLSEEFADYRSLRIEKNMQYTPNQMSGVQKLTKSLTDNFRNCPFNFADFHRRIRQIFGI